jgi:hypothetical protein
MIMASCVVSSPMIEQLHCSGPTGRILWIMNLFSLRRPDSATGGRRSLLFFPRVMSAREPSETDGTAQGGPVRLNLCVSENPLPAAFGD